MKKHTFAAALCGLLTLTSTHLSAQEVDDKYVENDVVSLAGKKGFSFSTKAGDFLFKPYALVQASACLNRYDDLGLETPYADNIANTGFAIPNAILGFTGKAFGKVTFNLSINAAKSGGALLQQAWFDIAMKESLRIRVGKFKTPFMHAYLSTLGEIPVPGTSYLQYGNSRSSLRSSLCQPQFCHRFRFGYTVTWVDPW